MSQALRSPRRFTAAEYLDFENAASERHELVDGIVYAMVGGTDRHNLIAFTMAADIFANLTPPCQVFQGQMRLRILTQQADIFYYPDVMVSCSASDRDPAFRQEPVLLAEVLSPSTERTDRGEKFLNYRQIASLQEYVIMVQDVPQVEIYRRRSAWNVETLFLPDTLKLESLKLELPVAQLYRAVTF